MISKLKKINYFFLFIIILLSIIGFASLYSAAGGDFDPWAKKHAYRFIIFFIFLFIIVLIDINFFYRYAYIIFFISLIFLGVVAIAGTFGLGAKRWIYIFGISIQPSELIKVSIILALSKYYHDLRYDRIGKISNIIFPLLIIIIPSILILLQPDLGTSFVVLLLGASIMFCAGIKIWKFLLSFLIILISLPFIWQNIESYQQKRIISFLNPEADPLGQGYQLIQSKIALGSGGLTGKGFLQGTQSYLEYLPEKQTDFIFTLIGEEFGFIGTVFIIILYIFLILISYYISFKSNHVFGRVLSLGVSVNLFLYVILNIAMVTGLLPVVGIPLPLLSYGGTAMLSIMICFGLLLNADVNNQIKKLN